MLDIAVPVIQAIAAIVAAVATVVLAKFASGQYRVYRSQLRIMHRQAQIMRGQHGIMVRQTDIAQRQLLIQGPFITYDIYHLEIRLDKTDTNIVEEWRISLLWKNTGKDFASNVSYYIRSSIQPPLADSIRQ